MRVRDFQKLHKMILPELENYASAGTMLVAQPVEDVLRAFDFEDSGFSKEAFYVWAFVLPLYIPASYVSYTLGKRISQGKRWWYEPGKECDLVQELLEAIRADGLPLLNDARTPADVLTLAQRHFDPSHLYVQQAVAYSLIVSGQFAEAADWLNKLTQSLATLDPTLAWPKEVQCRANYLIDCLKCDPTQAVKRLQEWEEETVRDLRLTKLYSPD